MVNILITIPACFIPPHNVNYLECIDTWIPLIKEIGYDVIFTSSKTNIEKNYVIEGDFFYSNAEDTLENLFYKRVFNIADWFISNEKYSHIFFIDSDSFVDPLKFHKEMVELFTGNTTIDYMGCAIPYQNWNPFDKFTTELSQPNLFAAGCGYMLSKKALTVVRDNFKEEDYINITKGADDWIVGDILYKNGISLIHNNSISCESKWKRILVDPSNVGVPDISDKESHLFLQHYCNNKMREIMDKLELNGL